MRGLHEIARPERLPRPELFTVQLQRLNRTLERVYERVPFYRRALDQAGVRPGEVRSFASLWRLPLTTKDDLRAHYPFGLFAEPLSRVARLHATSGTRGKPTLVGYTRADLENWAELCARLILAAGGRPGDALHVALNYGLFTGGLGVHGGAERLGCTVIPASAGSSARQVQLLADLRPAGIKSTPSFALHLADTAERLGFDPARLGLRYGVFGAEPWSEAMRTEIERRFGLTAYDSYGLSEMYGPGVAFECERRDGLHVSEDHFVPEVVAPDGRPLPPSEEGELVLTSLTKEAYPLLRYRTGDRTAFITAPCACGRTTLRIQRIKGRVDDMLVLRGVNLFPSEVERVLLGFVEFTPHYQIVLERRGSLDVGEVTAELTPAAFAACEGLQGPAAEGLQKRLETALHEQLGVRVGVRLVAPGSVPRSEGANKAVRVIDRRGK